ncbi:MAG: hypothetical protein RLZZ231_1622 [Bacteroidota bacterium]
MYKKNVFLNQMKKIATLFVTLLLTTMFLYNMAGIHLYSSEINENNWVETIEKTAHLDYKVLRLNATLYSFMEDSDFEYVNENITVDNKVYHIFKKRVQNNIISFYYLPNHHQSAIINKLKQSLDQSNGVDNKKNTNQNSYKLIKDFVPSMAFDLPSCNVVNRSEKAADTSLEMSIHTGYYELPYSPPKLS